MPFQKSNMYFYQEREILNPIAQTQFLRTRSRLVVTIIFNTFSETLSSKLHEPQKQGRGNEVPLLTVNIREQNT